MSKQLGIDTNRSNTTIMKAIKKNNNRITLKRETLEETDSLTYVGIQLTQMEATMKMSEIVRKARVKSAC